MITPDQAQLRVLALGHPVETQTLPLIEAAGRWTAGSLTACRTQPARDLSAMDGYAVRFDDLPGPWTVIGQSAAGAPFGQPLAAGQAVRIFTGAALPEGSDTIVIQEDVAPSGATISLTGAGPNSSGQSVRFAGSDFTAGDVLVDAGHKLTPAVIALAAIGGHDMVAVRRRIRVAIISTGDELVPLGADPGLDRLPGSNGVMLQAMLRDLPVDVTDLGIVPDDRKALAAAFDEARTCDIVVTTGGASVGDHDLVRPGLIEAGATLDFWKVAMRPGKPLMAGTLGQAVVLGLPGNPVSAFVTGTLFLLPLVRHLAGATDALPPRMTVELGQALPVVGPRTDFVRARWQDGRLIPLPSTDSGALRPLAGSDALIIRPAFAPPAAEGTRVEAMLIA